MAQDPYQRILITGGAGFVGSSLALRLRAAFPHAHIICLDNLYRRGSELNRERVVQSGAEFRHGDVRHPGTFDLPPCDLVIDAAAEPSVLAGRTGDAAYVVETNLVGTLHALEAARRWKGRFLLLSTSRVYPVERLRRLELVDHPTRFELAPGLSLGGVGPEGIREDFPLDGSRTLYGATKLAAEILVSEYAAQFALRCLINRCGVLAGPWQMGRVEQGVVALWVAAHHYGRPLTYLGYGGKQVRDALHVEDLADLVVAQLQTDAGWDGSVFNVGGGRPVTFSLRELTELAATATGRRVPLGEDPNVRPGDIPWYVTDASRAREAFGWQPRRSMEKIVADLATWLRAHSEMLRPFLAGG